MLSGKGAVELLKVETTEPAEFQSIISQQLSPLERVEPMGKQFHADYKAYAVEQLLFTRTKFKHGISVLPSPGKSLLFLELPLSGQLELNYRGRDISFSHNSTYLIASYEPILYRYRENANHITVGIDLHLLNAYAQKLVNSQQEQELTLHPQLLWRSPEAASFRGYLEFITRDLVRGGNLFNSPLVATEVQNTIFSMLLSASDNNYFPLETQLEEACLPAYVRQAREYIEANLEHPVSLADITAAAGVHVTTLLKGFKQHYEISPMAYFKQKRLEAARRTLLAAEPFTISVAQVANQWGFFHLSRFARDYRQLFGELPSETLKR